MNVADSRSKIRDVTTKPLKLEQTNEKLTIQFLPEKKFLCIQPKKPRIGRDSNQTIGRKGDDFTCISKEKKPGSC